MTLVDIVLLILIIFSTLHWWPSRYWLFEVSGYFSQQIFILLFIFSILRILSPPLGHLSIVILILSVIVAILHLRRILPYTFLGSKEVQDADPANPGHQLSFIVANVYQYNRKYDKLLALVEKVEVDVIILLETDLHWTDYLVNHIDDKKFSFRIIVPQDDTYGLAFFSRYPIEDATVDRISDIPSIQTIIRTPSGQGISLFVVHPKPPVPGEAETSWPKKRELLGVARAVSEARCEKIIVTGDLNEVAWSRTSARFLQISQLSDPRRGRSILNTFPAYFPLLGFPLDHFYCSKHFKIVQYRRLENIGSDHFPLLIEFSY